MRLKEGTEHLAHLITLPPSQTLRIQAGREDLNLTSKDLENFRGTRVLRGERLPREYRGRVDRVEVGPGE